MVGEIIYLLNSAQLGFIVSLSGLQNQVRSTESKYGWNIIVGAIFVMVQNSFCAVVQRAYLSGEKKLVKKPSWRVAKQIQERKSVMFDDADNVVEIECYEEPDVRSRLVIFYSVTYEIPPSPPPPGKGGGL